MQFAKKFKYLLFFMPISIAGLSVNYFFIFLYLKPKIIVPKDSFVKLFLIYIFCSFMLGIFIYSEGDSFFLLRQLVSFLLFLALYLLLFIKIDVSIDDVLKAVIIVATVYSLYALFIIFTNSAFHLTDIYFIKGGLREYVTDWPQRYAVLLVFACIVSFSLIKKSNLYIISTMLILITVIFTFTRAAYMALVIGMFFYFILSVKKKSMYSYKSFFYLLIFISIIIYLVYTDNKILFDITQITDRSIEAIELFFTSGTGHEGSDSERLKFWKEGFNILEKNIATGTGFAGIYLFYPTGSMHSQYMDVTLRVGIVGLLLYLYLWFKLFKYYYKYSVPIFSGLVAIFVFGFFHETTKLTYVGLLFFILLNYALHNKTKEKLCVES